MTHQAKFHLVPEDSQIRLYSGFSNVRRFQQSAVSSHGRVCWFDNALVVWLSAGLALAAPVVGYLLKQAGYGVGGSKSSSH